MKAYPGAFSALFHGTCDLALDPEWNGRENRLFVERITEALREANCLLERSSYIRLLDVGGKMWYGEILD